MGSLKSLVVWVLASLAMVAVGTFIINRVAILKTFVYGTTAA